MDERESAIFLKLLERANPPPVLHRYRAASSRTLEEISNKQIFVASPDDLNDPFECSAPVFWNRDSMRRHFIDVFAPTRGISATAAATEFDSYPFEQAVKRLTAAMAEIRKDSGMICLSAVPNSIRMWSYYAQHHEGICVGFDTAFAPFMAAMKVLYQNLDVPLDVAEALKRDPSKLAAHIYATQGGCVGI